jgi:prepilin peptidase CpaA
MYFDSAHQIIPNYITIPSILVAWIISLNNGFDLFLSSLFGTLVGFSILLLPYVMGGVGGGDVKLLAAIGSLTNFSFLFELTFWGLIVSGIISMIILYKKGRLFSTFRFKRFDEKQKHPPIYIPLGSCFCGVGILLLFI